MSWDIRLLIDVAALLVGLGVAYATLRGQVNDAKRDAEEASRRADAAHRRLDAAEKQDVDIRLDIRELRTRLDALGEIRRSQEALALRFEELAKELRDREGH